MVELNNSLFLRAVRRESTPRPPIWLMRQAGRYMDIYRTLRAKHTLLEMVKSPELACEVTLQPIDAFGLDAAIIFSDILPLLEGMGLHLEFRTGEGPHLDNPLRTHSDVENLRAVTAQESMGFTLDAIKLVRHELDPRGVPLIGFSGSPFTLACYAIEGGGSKEHARTKALMYSAPQTWHLLMSKLSIAVGEYLAAQAHAGAHVVQLFDSWAGALSPQDYTRFVLPYVKQSVEIARAGGVPILYFSTGTAGMLDVIKQLPVDGFSIDWRMPLDQAWQTLGTDRVLQGNLDPVTLFAPWDELQSQAQCIMDNAKKIHADRRGFIFNIGHGILQHTPEDNVRRLVDWVKAI